MDPPKLKISVLRKSASPSTRRNVLMSKWKGNTALTHSAPPSKMVNDSVAKYVTKCNTMMIEPVLEYVVAISDPSVVSCTLSGRKQSLTDTEIMCIAESLCTNMTIKDLDLRGNTLMSLKSSTEIAMAIKANKNMTKLDLGENDMKSEGVLHIAAGLRENPNSFLQVLALASNQIGNHGAAGLAEMLAVNTSLRELNLQHNNIKDQGIIAIAAALKVNSTLQVLNLRFNEVSDVGAGALGTTLRFNLSLAELDLGGNKIGDAGAEELANGLQENGALLKINLRSNLIGDNGTVCIAESLKINSTLIELYMGSNQIASTGCTAITDSLKENTVLSKLDLQGIEMGTSGALALADALRVNTSVVHLVVELNQLGKEEATTIASAIRANPSLTEINVGNGDITNLDPEVVSAITSTLKLNKYVAGIIEDTGFPGYFNSPVPMVVGTSLPHSPSPGLIDIPSTRVQILNKEREKEIGMEEMLSTMGDKVKNLMQRERGVKRTSVYSSKTTQNTPSSPPHSSVTSNKYSKSPIRDLHISSFDNSTVYGEAESGTIQVAGNPTGTKHSRNVTSTSDTTSYAGNPTYTVLPRPTASNTGSGMDNTLGRIYENQGRAVSTRERNSRSETDVTHTGFYYATTGESGFAAQPRSHVHTTDSEINISGAAYEDSVQSTSIRSNMRNTQNERDNISEKAYGGRVQYSSKSNTHNTNETEVSGRVHTRGGNSTGSQRPTARNSDSEMENTPGRIYESKSNPRNTESEPDNTSRKILSSTISRDNAESEQGGFANDNEGGLYSTSLHRSNTRNIDTEIDPASGRGHDSGVKSSSTLRSTEDERDVSRRTYDSGKANTTKSNILTTTDNEMDTKFSRAHAARGDSNHGATSAEKSHNGQHVANKGTEEAQVDFDARLASHKTLEYRVSTQNKLLLALKDQIKALKSGKDKQAGIIGEIQKRLAQQEEAWKDLTKALWSGDDKQTGIMEEVRNRLAQQEGDFKKLHGEQMEMHKLFQEELDKESFQHQGNISFEDINEKIEQITLTMHTMEQYQTKLEQEIGGFNKILSQEAAKATINKLERSPQKMNSDVETHLDKIASNFESRIYQLEEKMREDSEKTLARLEEKMRMDFEKTLAQLEEKLRHEEQAKVYLNEVRITTFGERITFMEKEVSEKLRLIEKQTGLSAQNNTNMEQQNFSNYDGKMLTYLEDKMKRVEELVRHQQAIVKTIETRTQSDNNRTERKMAEMWHRMDILEETLQAEQETSLKALEAILDE